MRSLRQIGVVVDESGELIGAMLPMTERRIGPDRPQSIHIVPDEGQVVMTVDVPEELANRVLDAEYLETLQQYVVRDRSLVRRPATD